LEGACTLAHPENGQIFDDAWKELKTINVKQQLKARRWENPEIKFAT